MNFRKILLAILTCLVFFASCVKFDNTYNGQIPLNPKGEYAIVLSSPNQMTKAIINSDSGTGYDEFSLYAWNSNNEVIMNPFSVKYDTQSGGYKYDGIGTQTLQYFKNNADSYSFIGVIPTSNTTLNNESVTVGVESFVVDDTRAIGTLSSDSSKEFLWARADVEKVNYGQPVTLPFKHGNALLYLGFISDDANTQIIDYTPHVDAQPATTGTESEISSRVFDELVAGNTVGWPYATDQSMYAGSTGTYLNYEGSGSSTARITNTRLAELMSLVNAQFIYTDKDGNNIGNIDWVKNANRKNTVYLKFADGVNTSDFLAGNDAFWTNLTDDEKVAMQNWYNSGIRVARINQVSGGNYFVWGMMNTQTTIKVITGGSPAIPESGYKGIRVFSAKSDPTVGYAHLEHTNTADAIVTTGLTFDNRVTSNDVIQYSLPANTIIPVGTNENDAVYSPTTFYAIPGDTGLTHFVVKLSYTYNGTTVYDVRVPIELPTAGLEAGKYYKYIINITSIGNGTNDPNEANDEKDDIDITNNPIHVTVNVTPYEEGEMRIITI